MNQMLRLQGDIRQAVENYLGDKVSDPWDSIIEILADIIEDGITLERAANLEALLELTH